jgi:nucleotide-binding universal stress UspA family protein
MTDKGKVLVAVDFSGYTDETVKAGAELCSCMGAELVLLNVIHQKDLDALKFIEATTELVHVDQAKAEMTQKRKDRMNELVTRLGIQATTMISEGVPWEEILAVAEEIQAGMIVVGTKGRSDLERTLFGSNAEKVYRHAKVTVVSVRGDLHTRQLAKLRGA